MKQKSFVDWIKLGRKLKYLRTECVYGENGFLNAVGLPKTVWGNAFDSFDKSFYRLISAFERRFLEEYPDVFYEFYWDETPCKDKDDDRIYEHKILELEKDGVISEEERKTILKTRCE